MGKHFQHACACLFIISAMDSLNWKSFLFSPDNNPNFVNSFEEAEDIIRSYEIETTSKFVSQRKTAQFGFRGM